MSGSRASRAGAGDGGAALAAYPWISDPATRGAWLLERLDAEEFVGLGDWLPGGFDAYVRVLHPFSRDRPEAGGWAEWEAMHGWEEAPELVDESRIPWRDAAAAFGRSLGATTRSEQVLGVPWGEQEATAPDGWRYSTPEEGSLDGRTLAALMPTLLAHTATPDRGVAAVWEGFGGLVSAQGVGFFVFAPPRFGGLPAPLQRVWAMMEGARLRFALARQRFGTRAALHGMLLPRLPQPRGSGLLSREAAAGPRLVLPSGIREYVCFEVDPRDFASGAWIDRAPWAEPPDPGSPDSESPDPEPGPSPDRDAQSPQLLWPEGREWVVATEIDFDSTIVGCSRACADALLAASAARSRTGAGAPSEIAAPARPDFEAFEISRDTEKLWHDVGEDPGVVD